MLICFQAPSPNELGFGFWFFFFFLGCMKVTHVTEALNFLSMFNATSPPIGPVSGRMERLPQAVQQHRLDSPVISLTKRS